MLLAPNDGEVLLLNILLGKATAPTSYYYRLYKNDVIPAEGSHRIDFAESSAPGYAAQSINPADWTVATDANGATTATASTRTFPFTGGETLYGYIVTGSDGTNLYWAERFGSPITIPAGGGQLDLNPAIS